MLPRLREPEQSMHSDKVQNDYVPKTVEERRLAFRSLTRNITILPGLNGQEQSKHSGSEPSFNVTKNIEERRLALRSLTSGNITMSPGLNGQEQSKHSCLEPSFNVPKNIEERRLALRSLTSGNITMSPGLNGQEQSRHSGSEPSFNVPKNIEERRLSLQILPWNTIESPENKAPEPVKANINKDHKAQASIDAKKMKDYVSFLILRTYTFVIVLMFIYMVYLSLPVHILSWLEIRIELITIDIYFVPVFWICYEKEAWSYTVKNVKNMCLSVVLRFYRE